MSFLPQDSLNCEILALSLGLQRELAKHQPPTGPLVGAQQVMPKAEHAGKFGPKDPLPWIPDLVGVDFSREKQGVLVVGSSYNGFIEGYSARSMKLEDYLQVRDLIHEGTEQANHPKVAEACKTFSQCFMTQVVARDESTYYDKIFETLLAGAGIPTSQICLTDLCKASFVQRGRQTGMGNRGDEGSDRIIKDPHNWPRWINYLICKRTQDASPLPYQWIWKRMQQCRHIVALGTIAEYGVIKIFQKMAGAPAVRTRGSTHISLNGSLDPNVPWEYCYADSSRKMAHWLSTNDWWRLRDDQTGNQWSLLPVYHPSARLPHADPDFKRSKPILNQMMTAKDS